MVRVRRRSPPRAWIVAWTGAATLGVLNGVVRDTTYGPIIGEQRAHQASTVTLLAALTTYTWRLERRWPLETTTDAVIVGGAWAALTLAFEFGLGRNRGMSWEDITADYDIRRGRLWVAVPVFMLVGPALVRHLRHGG